MKAPRVFVSLAALALAAAPALAGHDGKKCSYTSQQCLDKMAKHCSQSGWVGVELEKDEKATGMTVTKVVPGGPAEAAGIQVGDRLIALEGVAMSADNHEKLAKVREKLTPGATARYTVVRDGQEREVAIKLGKIPESVAAQMVGSHLLGHATPADATTAQK